MKRLYVTFGAILALILMVSSAQAGYRSGGGFSSGRSYSSPSRSYSPPSRSYLSPSPSYRSPTPSYKSPSPTYKSPTPTYQSPSVTRTPSTVLGRSTIVEHHYYGGGYGGYGGGGFMSNPFFWLWAMDSHHGGYGGGYAQGAPMQGGVQADGTVMVYPPTPIWITLTTWFGFLLLIGLFIWGLAALWRWAERW